MTINYHNFMKRNFFSCIALIAFVLILSGCKKDSTDNPDNSNSLKKSIVGKWLYHHDVIDQYTDGEIKKSIPYTYPPENGYYAQFNIDGTGSESKTTFTYTIKDDIITINYAEYVDKDLKFTIDAETTQAQISKVDGKNLTMIYDTSTKDANGKRKGWIITEYLTK